MHIQLAAAARTEKSREKSIKRWYCEVWLYKQHPSILPTLSFFSELQQKQVARKKYLWDCLVLWLLLVAETLAKTLVERTVFCEGKGLHLMLLAYPLPLYAVALERQQSRTQF